MTDPAKRSVDCGCCAGIDAETPARIENPAGLPAIAYRTGSHARFRESLLARLSSSAYPALRGLGSREDGDFTIALCDAFSTALDVLTFYQERIANETYLRTATERRSVLEMAALIGYELAPGVAASTYLAFTLQETPGAATQAPAPVEIPVGTRVQSVPAQDEKPQTFETIEAIEARVEWNAMLVQTTERWQPTFGDRELWLEGVATQLQPGDALLIVGRERETEPGDEHWDVRVLDAVEADPANGRTRVALADGLGSARPHIEPAASAVRVYAFRRHAALFGHNAPDPNLMSTGDSNLGNLIETDPNDAMLKRWKHYAIGATIDLDTTYRGVVAGSWIALVSNETGLGRPSLPGYVELYRARLVYELSRTNFGLSAKVTRIEPDTAENLSAARFGLHNTLALVESAELPVARRPRRQPLYGDRLSLEHKMDGLRAGRAIAVSGRRQRIAIRAAVSTLRLLTDSGATRPLGEYDSLQLLETPARQIGSTTSRLDPESFLELLEGRSTTALRLRVRDRDGNEGRLDATAAEIRLDEGRDSDPVVAEIAFIATTATAVRHDRDRTHLELSAALKHCYERASVRVNGNVAHATHGETVEEILGGGDARTPDPRFVLRQKPLTYLSANTPDGRASSLDVRINDLLWTAVPSLYARAADARVYTLDIDDEANTIVRFGDSVEGARPPSGQNNIRATYRKGIGVAGNLAVGRLTTLLSRPLGVSGVGNPEPATGGEDAETLDRARGNAPLTVLTLDRAVSIRDYADFARAFAGIDKAYAVWVPAGPARGVFLTVAGIDGAAVTQDSDTFRHLQASLRSYGDPLIPLRLVSYRPVTFRLQVAVKVTADREPDKVLVAVAAVLRLAFGFRPRTFGQGVSLDEVVAVAHTADGVEAVRVSQLYRADAAPGLQPRLRAALPVAAVDTEPEPAELLTLDVAPFNPGLLP